jgi:hypothetical protein
MGLTPCPLGLLWFPFRSGSVRCMCRGFFRGVLVCCGVDVLSRRCPGFVVVSMGLLEDVPALSFVVLLRSVLLEIEIETYPLQKGTL